MNNGFARAEGIVEDEVGSTPEIHGINLEPIEFDKNLLREPKKVYKIRIDNYDASSVTTPDFALMPEYEYKLFRIYDSKTKFPHMNRAIPIAADYNIAPQIQISTGQVELSDFDGQTIRFISERETRHDEGAKLYYSGQYFNYSTGIFSSTANGTTSAGSVISTKPINLYDMGTLRLGGGHYAYDVNNSGVNTVGLFSEYRHKKFKLNTQYSNSRNMRDDCSINKIYILPELALTNTLSLKYIHKQNLTEESYQHGFGLKYKPKTFTNKLEFEVDTTTKYYNYMESSQRLNFSTKFKI